MSESLVPPHPIASPWHRDPDPRVGKSQELRLWDVFFFGPAVFAIGFFGRLPLPKNKIMEWVVRGGVMYLGFRTVTYNWPNYLRLNERIFVEQAAQEITNRIVAKTATREDVEASAA